MAWLKLRLALLLAIFCIFSVGLGTTYAQEAQDGDAADEDGSDASVTADELDPAFAAEWMQLLYDRIQEEGVNPPAAARLYAYAGVTLYESILPGMPANNSLSGQVNELPLLSWTPEGFTYDWASVANGALSTMLTGLFEDRSDESRAAFAELREQQAARRAEELGEAIVERSLAYGDLVGAELLAWSRLDNYRATRGRDFQLWTGDPSYWTPTSEGQEVVEPYWGEIRPFVLSWTDECAVYPNMPFSAEPDSTFYAQAMEVLETGSNLTNEQKEIAQFWVDTPAVSGTPAGHWVLIENGLVDQLDLNLTRAAEMYALVGMALGDSFISCWSLKYQVMLLRPVTYIRQNINRRWSPYIETPGFPEYPSGHSVVSAAAAEVLTSLFGTVAFTSRNYTVDGWRERSFTSFEAAAAEASISRIYGGIHFRAAVENGMRQGRCVGERITENIVLNPVRQGE